MSFVSEKKLLSQIRKFGFKNADSEVVTFMNTAMLNFAHNEYGKYAKKIEMNGGRISLPSEYFGVESGRYTSQEGHVTSMESTSELIRPHMEIYGMRGVPVGGADEGEPEFKLSLIEVGKIFNEVMGDLNILKRNEVIKCLKVRLENALTSVLVKVKKSNKKAEVLYVDMINKKLPKKFM